jgi:endonuclease-8
VLIGHKVQHNAAALRTALLGKKMVRFEAPLMDSLLPQVGRTIEEVRNLNKSIEIIWDNGIVLNTRMKMMSSWDVYRDGDTWRKDAARADVLIEVQDWVAVCFNTPEIDVYHDFDPRRHPILGKLGPDLSHVDADIEEAVDRMMEYEERDETVAEVLLDQRVVRGVSNVFRCEILWACEMHPWANIGTLKRAECRELLTLAHEMLQNADTSLDHLAIYGRQGKSCARCGVVAKVNHHGEANRVLYWCAGCQTSHEPLVRPNFTPLYIERDVSMGDSHPAAKQFMSEIISLRDVG